VELGPKGIRVNTVSPGTIDTPMLQRSLKGMNPDQVANILAQTRAANALGRIGTPEEIADVVVFLCSAGAGYITGEDIVVDAGYLRVKNF
jgi:NAD(P)-dependent dehydrogenase (short-subunit alcohol dehydrogenase family)